MQIPRGTLEQWRALQAVVDHGGYAQAADALYRSQSTISYAINRLQEQLGVQLLEVQGRRAKLTKEGEVLLRLSRQLLKDAMELEELAAHLSHGREAEINLVVEAAFPMDLLIAALKKFAPISKGTRVQLKEVVLSGADEALQSGSADLVISHRLPPDYLADPLLEVEFVAVAHRQHELHHLNRPLTADDLSRHMQVVIRDSGLKQNIDGGWLGAEHRWTVTSIGSAAAVIRAGLGFAWLPRHLIQPQLDRDELRVLPLAEGQVFPAMLYLIYGKPKSIGPATQQLADILFATARNIQHKR